MLPARCRRNIAFEMNNGNCGGCEGSGSNPTSSSENQSKTLRTLTNYCYTESQKIPHFQSMTSLDFVPSDPWKCHVHMIEAAFGLPNLSLAIRVDRIASFCKRDINI